MEQYISKSAVVAEIERRVKLNETCQKISGGNEFYRGAIDEAKEILSFLNTHEVKDVDLNEEVTSYIHSNTCNGYFRADIHDVAKHFFELGLNSQTKDMQEALRTEYEKGRADVIAEMEKLAWSEADSDFMYDTLSNLTEIKYRYGEGYGNVGKCIDWLKSLKQRIGG